MKNISFLCGVKSSLYNDIETFDRFIADDLVIISQDPTEIIKYVVDCLKNYNKDVVISVETLPSRLRSYIYREVKRLVQEDVHVTCRYVFTSFKDYADYQLKHSTQSVDFDELKEIYASQSLPKVGKDCDDIVYIDSDFELIDQSLLIDVNQNRSSDILKHLILFVKSYFKHSNLSDELMMNYVSHDHPNHLESVDEHISYVINNMLKIDKSRYNMSEKDHVLLIFASVFHDLAKGFTKTFRKKDDEIIGFFKNHEKLSSIYACRLLNAGFIFLEDINLSEFEISEICEIVRYHMILNDKHVDFDKYARRHQISEHVKKLLKIFNVVDQQSRVSGDKF